MLKLVAVKDADQVEWLRRQRNRPELYKYFRQDRPISRLEQSRWWKGLDKTRVCLFIIEADDNRIGYVGFNPLLRSEARAEFGIFIVPEHGGKGYGTKALQMLLKHGFDNLGLRTIYSDCLEYPGEDKFGFYEHLGFEAYPAKHQKIRYIKSGKSVPATKFFMTKDMWENKYGPDGHAGLGPDKAQAAARATARSS